MSQGMPGAASACTRNRLAAEMDGAMPWRPSIKHGTRAKIIKNMQTYVSSLSGTGVAVDMTNGFGADASPLLARVL